MCRDSAWNSHMMFLRTSGSPPVMRSLRTPRLTKAVQMRSSSSSVSSSRRGRKLMCSDMQYTHRKSHRSVTDTLR